MFLAAFQSSLAWRNLGHGEPTQSAALRQDTNSNSRTCCPGEERGDSATAPHFAIDLGPVKNWSTWSDIPCWVLKAPRASIDAMEEPDSVRPARLLVRASYKSDGTLRSRLAVCRAFRMIAEDRKAGTRSSDSRIPFTARENRHRPQPPKCRRQSTSRQEPS